jgi:hypothetical protein
LAAAQQHAIKMSLASNFAPFFKIRDVTLIQVGRKLTQLLCAIRTTSLALYCTSTLCLVDPTSSLFIMLNKNVAQVLALVLFGVVNSFSSLPVTKRRADAFLVLGMGLYDDPLPPRPPKVIPREEEEESDDEALSSNRLFSFDKNGKELRNLLPNLARRTSFVDCYYEPTDQVVINLIQKTGCHPQDACWALEATKGDLIEAWTCISTARRMQLNDSVDEQETSGSRDFMLVELEEEFEERKEARQAAQQKSDRDEFFRGGVADQPWLPRKNPKPVDDEPWFTG